MRRLPLAALAAVVLLSACAPTPPPAPVVTTPQFPEFVAPPVPAAFSGSAAAINEARGWAFLQTGDFKSAEREFSAALLSAPSFYPAEASLGYVALARKDPGAALPHFDRALQGDQHSASALTGRGQALVALDRNDEALAAFEAALAADPSLADVRRRVDVLRFRAVEQNLARARQAAGAGRLDEAIAAYTTAIASSPESPFLYRELAGVERQKGDRAAALDHLRKAVSLDPTDAKSIELIGDVLEAGGDYAGAQQAFEQAEALEPSPELERRIAAARAEVALARLPAEYRAIGQSAAITRADLAALIGIRLAPLLPSDGAGDAVVITDVGSHWAAAWIMAVARAGIMEPYANHAFQPDTIVRRVDLAQAVARVIARMAPQHQAEVQAWQSARLAFSDLSSGHLAYPAASAAVAAGIMKTTPDHAFEPLSPVSGAEAVEAIARLEQLAGTGGPMAGPPR